MHVKIPGDIDNACALKVAAKAKAKTPIQPYLILVGPNALDLKKIYIQVDNHRFEASTFADGFDLLFKFYLMFKLAYPIESQHFWYFIQWGVYKIKTESDVQIPSIFTIVNKLKINLPNPGITQNLAQAIIKDFQLLMTKVSTATLKNLKQRIPAEYHELMERYFDFDIFDNFDSNWRCMQQFKASSHYVAPQQIKIGEISDNKVVDNIDVWTKKPCFGQIIPLRAHHAQVVKCRINILLTLARKLQLDLSKKFLTNEGFKNFVELGSVHPSFAFHLSNNSENNSVFGIITAILSDTKTIYFSYKKCTTIGLNTHIKAYQLIAPKAIIVYLYSTLVRAGCLYGVETWGCEKVKKIEVLQNKLDRSALGVARNTPKYIIRREIGEEEIRWK
ncbi:Protein of unknown function [Cotesia congregata]|uniref:Uncharacterized protein n=1 Tax=Cotesia congregata TaxID=51543 RepID=A0A8J2HEM8_COTCN|nr:Protein of unknown function [Cotesia congregata]